MAHILVVDDKEAVRSSFVSILRREGHRVTAAGSVDEALRCIHDKPIDLILTDLRMPEAEEGLTMVEVARKLPQRPAVIVVTGYGSIASAVEAMRLGADDYVTKPLRRNELLEKVEHCLRQLGRFHEAISPPGTRGLREIVAENPLMRQVIEDARRLALTEDPILLVGEPGTGRSILARAIHAHSARARAPFLTVYGARLDAAKLERASAGAEASVGVEVAPSAAQTATTQPPVLPPPLFAPAAGGTVFIHEIEGASEEAQASLVQLLRDAPPLVPPETRSPRGVRVVASSSVDLEQRARTGSFRSDLFYLISRGFLQLPPLRDRPEDITPLAKHFIEKLTERGRSPLKISREARRHLLTHDWPGNVRELETLMERATALAVGDTLESELLKRLGLELEEARPAGEVFRGHIADAEREAIQKVIARHPRDLTGAARELGISRTTLWRKMKKYGMIQHAHTPQQARELPEDARPSPTERPAEKKKVEEQAIEGGA
ncbi:MAG: sigma-54 dependent transcriptional regulator [Planctomycetota bacterium]